jgi:excisionase family DNA binding protein
VAEDEDWLDAEAAARQLGLPTRLIYAMVRAGDLPALQFPVRIRRRDVHACLERCRIKPGDLAHLDPNRARRAGDVEPPVAASGRPDRRFGRRYGAPPN